MNAEQWIEGMKRIKIGDPLPNGAILLHKHERESGSWNVLALRRSQTQKYVTWVADEKGSTYWGHYHEDLEAAIADQKSRVELWAV